MIGPPPKHTPWRSIKSVRRPGFGPFATRPKLTRACGPHLLGVFFAGRKPDHGVGLRKDGAAYHKPRHLIVLLLISDAKSALQFHQLVTYDCDRSIFKRTNE